ncbi:ADP-ribosylation factor 2-like protein [Blastocystis sp. subtype 4]|uniref:ADP-ribosylation factor 2-like protein n=1 Tax=Blastocystis sp. subtype 4 TaxID=944170 RepID=UPI000711EA19|nr:ADP-ribosylation factor 2-like protein [Blastocystis sp. subtype 4]KNB42164.1 ADP-ribosylation factor 2-like protein [Blastocystis sp. subtype 4]|eukprot:XP_014525607.1 ADP-ribosylation factor 2-like protein [Blastocystis sp. subtype 4]
MAIDDQLNTAIWLIVANKQDLPNCVHATELESILDVNTLLNGRRYQVIETVATKNIGIAEEQELKKVFYVC